MSTAYQLDIDSTREGLDVELTCTTCGDEHRLSLRADQLDAVSWLAAGERINRDDDRKLYEARARLASTAAPAVVVALVWQLTHATGHQEQALRGRGDTQKAHAVDTSATPRSHLELAERAIDRVLIGEDMLKRDHRLDLEGASGHIKRVLRERLPRDTSPDLQELVRHWHRTRAAANVICGKPGVEKARQDAADIAYSDACEALAAAAATILTGSPS